MLRKLIKHEFRATARIMLPLIMLALVTAVGGNISVKYLLETESSALNIIGIILLTAFVVAMAAVCIMAVVVMVQRFYKNLLQDEGYITLTLPVSVHQHIWSKLVVSFVWFTITFIVVVLAVFILVYDMGMMHKFLAGFEGLGGELSKLAQSKDFVHVILIAIELLIMIVSGAVFSCMQFYASLALGHSFAKSKMLFSVLLFFGINFIMQLINGSVAAVAGNTGLSDRLFDRFFNLQGMAGVHPVLIAFILYNALFGTVLYFASAHCLKNRLNLE